MFVIDSVEERFNDTFIVMMGCEGLHSKCPVLVFLDKGASAFVSWSQLVSAAHTDAATEHLLELLLEGLKPADAVSQVASEVGPDPSYGAELRVLEAGS